MVRHPCLVRCAQLALGLVVAAFVAGCGGGAATEEGPSPAERVARVQARLARATVTGTAPGIPAYDPSTGNVVFPNVDVDGTMYGTAILHRNDDGTFSLANSPVPSDAVTVSASKYANGVLTVASVMVDGHRYTNAVLHLEASGRFVLVSVNDPLPTYRSGYESRNSNPPDNPTIPYRSEIANVTSEPGELGFNGRIAFGDFFQDGTHSAIALSFMFKGVYPESFNPGHWQDSPAKLYILRKDASGQWTDQTTALIKDGNRYTCVTPTFIEVADLNNDDRPDAVIACTGLDFTFSWEPGEDPAYYWAARQFLLSSQLDGSYKLAELPLASRVDNKIYGHQASVADIDADGNADILFVDPVANSTPFIMWGNGDGTFRQDMTRFPATLGAFGIRAVPVDGKFRVIVSAWAAGASPDYPAGVTGTQVFEYADGRFQLLLDLTPTIPVVAATGLTYDLGLDFHYIGGAYYGYFVDATYDHQAIVKFDAVTGASTLLSTYSHPGYAAGSGEFIRTSQDTFVNVTAGCSPMSSQPQDFMYYACHYSVPFQ